MTSDEIALIKQGDPSIVDDGMVHWGYEDRY